MQFLGVATTLFSHDYSVLVEQETRVASLEAERNQFLRVLNEVTREVVHAKEVGISVSTESVREALDRLEGEQARIQAQREDVLKRVQQEASPGNDEVVSQLSEALLAVRNQRETTVAALQKTQARMEELREYRTLLHDELSRMQRAVDAGTVLADLKVTHCPACDQPVDSNAQIGDECYLCKQSITTDGMSETAGKRVQFEVEQLQSELSETDELLQVLEQNVQKHMAQDTALRERQREIEGSLQPIRSAISALLPPEFALYDMESGRMQEQVRQLQRVMTTLEQQQMLTQRINELEKSIAAKQGPVAEQRRQIDFYKLGNLLSLGMNKYLTLLNDSKPGAYSQRAVHFTFWDRGFQITVGEGRWDRKLGATLSLYFLLAYHYALLRLTPRPECHYPGLSIIDFPAELPEKIVSEENFLVEPFIRMLGFPEMSGAQVIIAGSGFEGLEGVHRIPFTEVWK